MDRDLSGFFPLLFTSNITSSLLCTENIQRRHLFVSAIVLLRKNKSEIFMCVDFNFKLSSDLSSIPLNRLFYWQVFVWLLFDLVWHRNDKSIYLFQHCKKSLLFFSLRHITEWVTTVTFKRTAPTRGYFRGTLCTLVGVPISLSRTTPAVEYQTFSWWGIPKTWDSKW